MKLYFENSSYEKRFIGDFTSLKDAVSEIYSFCNERNFKIYYVRSWNDSPNVRCYDVGSWSEFFLLEKTDEENFADF